MGIASARAKPAFVPFLFFLLSCFGLGAQGTVTDVDGNVYKTVIIGTQVWMAENLKVTRFRNGDPIPTTNPATRDISGERNPVYQWIFENRPEDLAVYGRLYTWYAVMDIRGIAPEGWHVPSDEEWKTLAEYLGGDGAAGGKMKEAGAGYWKGPNTGATNASGFTGLPGGSRPENGAFDGGGTYAGDKHHYGAWWSSTARNALTALHRYLGYNDGKLAVFGESWSGTRWGFSVRCVRDAPAGAEDSKR